MLHALLLPLLARQPGGCEDKGLPEGLGFESCSELSHYGLCDAFPTSAGRFCAATCSLCDAPPDRAHFTGWYASEPDQSCDSACEAVELMCSADEIHKRNHQIDSAEEVVGLVGMAGEQTAMDCQNDASNPAVPYFSLDKCTMSVPDRPLELFNCSAVVANSQRLCYCTTLGCARSQPLHPAPARTSLG